MPEGTGVGRCVRVAELLQSLQKRQNAAMTSYQSTCAPRWRSLGDTKSFTREKFKILITTEALVRRIVHALKYQVKVQVLHM